MKIWGEGIQWVVHPGWIIGYLSRQPIALGMHVVTNDRYGRGGGPMTSLAPILANEFKKAVMQYENALAKIHQSFVVGKVTANFRHEFIIANSAAINKCIVKDKMREFQVVLPFSKDWIRHEMKKRMKVNVFYTKSVHPLPVRITWNRLSMDETVDAEELFNQLINEGRQAYHVDGEKWFRAKCFDPDCEEYVLSFPVSTGTHIEREEVDVSLADLWLEMKRIMKDQGPETFRDIPNISLALSRVFS